MSLQVLCNNYLKENGYEFGLNMFHLTSRGAKKCKTMKNFPDLLILDKKHQNAFVVEIKDLTTDDTPSEGQLKALNYFAWCNIETAIIFTFEDFKKQMKKWGVVK